MDGAVSESHLSGVSLILLNAGFDFNDRDDFVGLFLPRLAKSPRPRKDAKFVASIGGLDALAADARSDWRDFPRQPYHAQIVT